MARVKHHHIAVAVPGADWPRSEREILAREYPTGGSPAVRKLLPHRTASAVKNAAVRYAVTYLGDRGKAARLARGIRPLPPDDFHSLPRMDLYESLACIQFRKWHGPVNREQPMRIAL